MDEDAEEHEEKKHAEEGNCHLGKMLKLIINGLDEGDEQNDFASKSEISF